MYSNCAELAQEFEGFPYHWRTSFIVGGKKGDRPEKGEGADVDEVREAAGQMRGRGAPADAVEPRPRRQPARELDGRVRPRAHRHLPLVPSCRHTTKVELFGVWGKANCVNENI